MNKFNVSFRDNWNKPIHRWYRFHAGCSSKYVEKMFKLLDIKNSVILDPFVGSGTVLVNSKERGIDSIGFDVNPFYVFISRVKTFWEFDLDQLTEQLDSFERELNFTLSSDISNVKNVPEYIWKYFDSNILKELSIIKSQISSLTDKQLKDFLLLALSSILISVSKVHHVGETIVFDKTPKTNGDTISKLYSNKICEMFSDLKTKQSIEKKGDVKVEKGDIKDLNEHVSDNTIDYVITHPPYANNYNYLLHDRLPLYFLDYFKNPSDEKTLRGQIIGSVTKNNLSQEYPPVINEVEKIARKIAEIGDPQRSKAVLDYFSSMYSFLEILLQKLKKNGFCAMLLGNSYMRGVMIPLDIIMAKIARSAGFHVVDICKVRDRGNGAFQHIYNGKLYESVLILKRH